MTPEHETSNTGITTSYQMVVIRRRIERMMRTKQDEIELLKKDIERREGEIRGLREAISTIEDEDDPPRT